MSARYDELVRELQATPPIRGNPGGRVIQCPAAGHDDVNPSASYRIGDDGAVLLHCHSRGCSFEDMLDGLGGFRPFDAFPPGHDRANGHHSTPQPRAPKPPLLPDPASWETTAIWWGRYIDAMDVNGPQHKRMEARDDDGQPVMGPNGKPRKRVLWAKGTDVNRLALYRAWDLAPDAEAVLVVEGEKVTDHLLRAGLPAVGTYGTGYTPTDAALEPLRGRRVALAPDNDDEGVASMLELQRRLEGIAASVVWVHPPAGMPRGWDLADCPADQLHEVIRRQRGPAPGDATTAPDMPAQPVDPDWPAAPGDAAYHGVLGEIAQAVAPFTEADPIGVLAMLLGMFGAYCGDGRTFYQGSRQATNLSVVLVGETAFGGRKGTALSVARTPFHVIDAGLQKLDLVGVASGEGIPGYLDRHPDDPRVLVVESEFARLLTIMNREGSTLSSVLRNAWDGVPLGYARSREDKLVIRHHVGLIGHITPTELRAKLSDADAANGFANRILWVAVRRVRIIPFPEPPDRMVAPFLDELRWALEAAQRPRTMEFDPSGRKRWESFYHEMAATPRLGLSGAITARHEAQVARLALVYALADREDAITAVHLDAAIALAEYARRSVIWALGDSTGNRHADALRKLLGQGEMPWKDAKEQLGLRTAADMETVVGVLVTAGLAELETRRRDGGGRPTRVIRAKDAKDAKATGGMRSSGQEVAA